MFVALMQTSDASSVASVGLLPRKSATLACEVYDFRLRSVALLHRKSATVGLWADDPKKTMPLRQKTEWTLQEIGRIVVSLQRTWDAGAGHGA